MALDYAALKAEIQNDPAALGYAAHVTSGDDQGIADLLNAPKGGVTVGRGTVAAHEVVDCIDGAEYAALSATAKEYLRMVVSAGTVHLGDGATRAALKTLFPVGVTRTALIALADKTGSRADELGWPTISDDDVSRALRDTP